MNFKIYFFFVDALGGIGVKKKYLPFIKSLSCHSRFEVVSLSRHALKSNVFLLLSYILTFLWISIRLFLRLDPHRSYLFVRSNIYLNFILYVFYRFVPHCFLPFLILEIPTPFSSLAKELQGDSRITAFLLIQSYKLASLCHMRVLYSKDECYESQVMPGMCNNTLYLGNWSSFSSYLYPDDSSLLDTCSNLRQSRVFNLVFVANLASWHGLDLFLKCVTSAPFLGKFNISILSPPSHDFLKLRSFFTESSPSSHLHFYESPSRSVVSEVLLASDIGIGVLAGYRKGLISASAIKHRDYMHFGLPVIYSGQDLDIDSSSFSDFCLGTCNNDEQLLGRLCILLGDLLSNPFSLPPKKSIIEYSRCNLSASAKANVLADFIISNAPEL